MWMKLEQSLGGTGVAWVLRASWGQMSGEPDRKEPLHSAVTLLLPRPLAWWWERRRPSRGLQEGGFEAQWGVRSLKS